ncbi:MAG: LptA/OstA family protein [Verrucomicrobiota bacterium]
MKMIHSLMALALLVLLTVSPSRAADKDKPENQTTVTSEQFKLDMEHHEGLFIGNVVLSAPGLKLRSPEMSVVFSDKDNKIERLVAKGGVEIEQPEKIAKATQVEYIVAEDKIILTGNPEVNQNKNKITGTTITIYRKDNRMDIDGHSRVLIFEELSSDKKK